MKFCQYWTPCRRSAGYPSIYWVYYTLYQYFKILVYSPENVILGIPLRKENSCRWQKYEQCSGGSKPWLYLLVLPQRQAKYNECTLEERVKVGGYGTENSPAKVARHFCERLDCKLSRGLCCSGYVIFGWRTGSSILILIKFKIRCFVQNSQI